MLIEQESDSDEEGEVPPVEEESTSGSGGKKINFTNNQSMIKKACLFPSFDLIQKFADDLHLHEKSKSTLGRIIKK